ncbi:MAG: DUF7670 domain-containing protein [Ferruginibacter sp.]
MSKPKSKAHFNNAYKILAQSVGMLVCLFFMLFIVGEGIPDIMNGKGAEFYPVLAMLMVPIIGYAISWISEKTGTVLLLAGGAFMLGYYGYHEQFKVALIYGLPFLATGILFMIHLSKQNKLKHKSSL